MNRLGGAFTAFVLLFVAVGVQADLEFGELRGLVEQRDFEAAYRLAETHRADFEGEPLFDFYYGVAALGAGHLSEGVFALERAVMQRPGFHRARLELARGYFMMGEDRRARAHFDTVLAAEPPEPVQATVERYLQRIQQRADRYSTVWTGRVELGAGYDDNVNSATDEETIEFLGLPVTLDDDSQKRGDSFLRGAAAGRVSRPMTRNTTVFGAAETEHRRYYDEGDFDTLRLGGRFGGVYHGDLYRLTLSGRLQRFWLDGERFQDLYGINAGVHRSLSARTALTGGAQLLRLRYDDQSHRDATLGLASLGVARMWGTVLQPVTSLSVFGGREDPRDSGSLAAARTERDIYGVQGLLRLQLAPAWALTTRVQYRRSDYGEEDPAFGETRQDDYLEVRATLDWQPTARWRVGPSLRYADNDSNIELFDYERAVGEVRVRYDF